MWGLACDPSICLNLFRDTHRRRNRGTRGHVPPFLNMGALNVMWGLACNPHFLKPYRRHW